MTVRVFYQRKVVHFWLRHRNRIKEMIRSMDQFLAQISLVRQQAPGSRSSSTHLSVNTFGSNHSAEVNRIMTIILSSHSITALTCGKVRIMLIQPMILVGQDDLSNSRHQKHIPRRALLIRECQYSTTPWCPKFAYARY